MILKTTVFILLTLLLSGCWYGVERMEPNSVDKRQLRKSDVYKVRYSMEVIKLGASKKRVSELFGNPLSIEKKSDIEIWSYPSTKKVLDGKAVCIGWIGIPARKETEGSHKLYFNGDKLTKIVSLETKSGFNGVYTDDSGQGVVSGEASKCRM
ncbi:hypothetical protein BMS3Abin11_01274 [bacterium BMS3Abin11]|nr:hypothetical protein BMS3Abin11_01274 [bacterium BMS3Abin11]